MTAEVTSPAPGEMSLIEHLAELRDRLGKAAVALVLGTIVGYIVFPSVLDILLEPYCATPQANRNADGECTLLALRALEPFSVRIKTSVLVGLFIGGPVIFYQLWRFITPGLTTSERRYALPFVILSQVMFGAGLAFAFIVLPQGLKILLGFGGDRMQVALTASEYLSFYLTTSVAFGLVFEIPLVLVFLEVVGILNHTQLRSFRPYALVLNVVLASIVTPTTDAVTLLFMAGPMALFYEIAILVGWLLERSKRKKARAEA